MRRVRIALYADFAVSLVLLGALLAWKLLVRGEEPGFLVLILAALLLINAALCLYSAVEIGRGRGRSAAKVWLFLAVFVLFYAAADLVGGAIFIRSTLFHNYPDKYVHHKMPPRMRYLMENGYGDFKVEMVTNNMGFRWKDIGEKKPGTYRIVMLGDSFTMGEGVPDGSTFPLLVEEYLNATGGRKYEVINLGVDGFPEYERTRENTKDRALRWIRNHLFITGILYETLNMRALNRQPADPANINVNTGVESRSRMLLLHTLEAPQLEETAEMYSMVEDSILRAKRLCDVYGCRFVLSVYPWGHQVNDKEWIPGRYEYMRAGERISDRTVDELGTFAGRNGIDFFNAFPSFRRYSGGERLYFMHDMHWTPAGQKLMAETLDGFIEKEIKKKPAAHVSY